MRVAGDRKKAFKVYFLFPMIQANVCSHAYNSRKKTSTPRNAGSICTLGVGEGTFKALHIRRERYSAIQIKYKLKGRKQVAK